MTCVGRQYVAFQVALEVRVIWAPYERLLELIACVC